MFSGSSLDLIRLGAVAFNLTEEDVGQIVQSSWMPKEVPDMITVVLYYDSDLTYASFLLTSWEKT
jgi:hypothetical protein